MSNIIINKLIKAESNIKYKLITKKYPEVNKIFGNENRALDLNSSIYDYSYIQYLNLTSRNNIVFKLYDYYIEEIAHLINDIKKNPTVEEIMYIYCYLLYNGYLSKNNDFKFLFPEKEVSIKMGLSIMYGQGVCRNVGELFSDILNMYDIKNYATITDREFYNKTFDTVQEFAQLINNKVENFVEQEEDYYKENPNTTGDHYEVLVKDNKWKLFDPSNCVYYNISKKDNGDDALKYIKLWSLYAQSKCNIEQTIKFYNFLKNKYLYLYNSKDKFLLQKECYKICEKNKTKILNFHQDNYGYIDKISLALDTLQKK